MEKHTNELIKESSPYLLQHAHNPVNWVPWSSDVFDRAKEEGKMVLISIGYSACHWCHVMEHESFEDEEVAAIMNKFFINVKVDREERPDVDQVYMTAVQLMTQKGGWPLNCMTLPDGRPIYGGTYFPKEQWMHILKSLHYSFVNEREKVNEYAANLHEGITQSEHIVQPIEHVKFEEQKLTELVQRWSKSFDLKEGGTVRAPKFPLPSNYEFLLDYALNTSNQSLLSYIELSLDKMAKGGIYDQIGGGFSRYSVDMLWKVQHFEKMLYDNGQLIGLFAKGYEVYGNELYKQVVDQTLNWLEREMLSNDGAFYAALDADSEGVEGKFYVWKEKELKNVLAEDYSWVKDFYNVNQRGYWEDGNYILLRNDDEAVRIANDWSKTFLNEQVAKVNNLLLSERNGRVHPGLDNKLITSWNALLVKGLCEAYSVFGDAKFKYYALHVSKWICNEQLNSDGSLWRIKKGNEDHVEGFLDDYALTISGFIGLYEVTFDEDWLFKANDLTEYVLKEFLHEDSKMFYYTSKSHKLIARKMEINDNVIPSSNSVMARNLTYLSKYFRNKTYEDIASQMLSNVYDGMEMYGSGYSNWAVCLNHQVFGLYEYVVVGEDACQVATELRRLVHQKVIVVAAEKESSLPIVEYKKSNQTLIYCCVDGTCLLPTTDVHEAANLVIQK